MLEYLVDEDATRAAIAAGYSKKTANCQGSQLLGNSKIRAAIKIGMKKRDKKIVKRSVITRERWLEEVRKLAFPDLDTYAKVSKSGFVHVVATEDRPKGSGRAIESLEQGRYGAKLKLHSKSAALALYAKAMGWTPDQLQNLGADGKPVAPASVVVVLPSNGRERVVNAVTSPVPPQGASTEVAPPVPPGKPESPPEGQA